MRLRITKFLSVEALTPLVCWGQLVYPVVGSKNERGRDNTITTSRL